MNSVSSDELLLNALTQKPRAVQKAVDKLLCEYSLRNFVEVFWSELEPHIPLVPGWPLDAICEHLTAVTDGDILRLAMNVCPGFMKSLMVSVFWPAFEWGPRNLPSMRYISTSYSQNLTIRDNIKFKNIITSDLYRGFWGNQFAPSDDQFTKIKVANTKTGWKIASSVGGTITGERANRFVCDDPNAVNEVESDSIRDSTNSWFRETVPTRLNNQDKDAILVIQQRVHELDVTGLILDLGLPYTHLVIPMEYDSSRHCVTVLKKDELGHPSEYWADPRGYDEDDEPLEGADLDEADGTLAWPDRYSSEACERLKETLGPYAYAGQFQQMPNPRGGGIFKRDWWKAWPPEEWSQTLQDKYANRFPDVSYVVASLDPALTSKQENDYSALTIWGVWRMPLEAAKTSRVITDEGGGFMRITDAETPRLMLMHAWQKRLELHGPPEERPANMTTELWDSPHMVEERQKKWGLVEMVAHSCRKFKVDLLLIENKGGGQHVSSELRTLLSAWDWGIAMVDPGGQDKVARAHGVVHLFSNGVVYAPLEKDWCDMVVSQCARFPRGKSDDLVDSMTQAITHLRETRWALRKEEAEADYEDELRFPSRSRPLYPV